MTDYTHFEAKNQFLEGAGSMIFDRANKIAYCALSPRADRELLKCFVRTLVIRLWYLMPIRRWATNES